MRTGPNIPGSSFRVAGQAQIHAWQAIDIKETSIGTPFALIPVTIKRETLGMQIQSNGGETWRPTPQAPTPPKPNSPYPLALTPSPTEEGADQKSGDFQAWGDDGLSFFDFIDVINPLQHLPIVGPVYRDITGDELGPIPRVAGGTLFFGPLGLVSSAIDVISEQITGKDVGGNIMTVMNDTDEETKPNPESVMIENPSETVSIGATDPVVAGTDAGEILDPVSAWAMSELNFRQAEAEKMGLNMPVRSYSYMLAGATAPEVASLPASALTASAPVSAPASAPASAPLPAAQVAAESQAASLRQQTAAPQPNLDQIKRAAAAYSAAYQAAASSKSVALAPERPLASATGPSKLNQRTPPGSLAKDGGWFAQTMLDALAKSRAAGASLTNPAASATTNGL